MFGFLDGAAFWWWLALALALGAAEMLAGSYVLIWPALAAGAVGLWLLAAPGTSGDGQVTLFAVATLALGAAGFALLRGRRAPPPATLNDRAARLVGRRGEATAAGQVTVGGDVWPARAADGGPLTPGAAVTVRSVEGGTLVVERG